MSPATFIRIAICAGCAATVAAGCVEPWPPGCRYDDAHIVGMDEATPEGDTGRALVARAAGPWSGTMKWEGARAPLPPLLITPAPSTSSIDIAVASTATQATYTPASAHQPDGVTGCGGWLSVEAVAQVVTGDGGFDEQWPISLDDNGEPDSARFDVDLRMEPVRGSFHLVDPDAASWDATFLGFSATFTTAAPASGSVYYGANRVRGDSHQGYSATVATWTAAASSADGGAR